MPGMPHILLYRTGPELDAKRNIISYPSIIKKDPKFEHAYDTIHTILGGGGVGGSRQHPGKNSTAATAIIFSHRRFLFRLFVAMCPLLCYFAFSVALPICSWSMKGIPLDVWFRHYLPGTRFVLLNLMFSIFSWINLLLSPSF